MRIASLLAILATVLLTGCQQKENFENTNEELLVSIEASIENATLSRYASNNTNGTPNSLKFTSGDKIGLFMEDSEVSLWTKAENGWEHTPNIYWPNKSETARNFYAFYPYPTSTQTLTISKSSIPMPSLSNQDGTIASLSACDFMVATAQQTYTENNGTVSFTGTDKCFKHINSLVAITILKESDLKESTINNISFTAIDIASTRTYSFTATESPITISETSKSNIIESSNLDLNMAIKNKNETLYFIVSSGIDLSNTTFCIEYITGTNTYIATKEGLGSGSFASGNRYNFNLNITDGVLNITGAEIQEWGEGTNMGDIIINSPTINTQNNENS